MSENNPKGKLIIKVTTALGAIPISNAQIYVVPYNLENIKNEDRYSLVTDFDGLTRAVELSAPSETLSLSPGSNDSPYSEYILSVQKDGFKTVEIIGLPIFDGVTSIQNVNLVPLTEDEALVGNDPKLIYRENTGYENLRNDNGEFRRDQI